MKVTKISAADKIILEKVLSDFEKDDFSLITPQQVHFLNKNPKPVWAEYIIFRYKFTNFSKDHIDSEIPSHLIVEPVSACNIRCIMCFQIHLFHTNQREKLDQ